MGIQNLSRTYLPLAKEDVGGPDLCCGYLKLQARRDYHPRGVPLPLVDWRPDMLQPARVGADQRARPEDDYLALTVAVGAHAHVRAATEAALHTLPAPDRLPDRSVLQKVRRLGGALWGGRGASPWSTDAGHSSPRRLGLTGEAPP